MGNMGNNMAYSSYNDFKLPGYLTKPQTKDGVWRCGIVFYRIQVNSFALKQLIEKTIKESNDALKNVKWIELKAKHKNLPIVNSSNYVVFVQNNDEGPYSSVGCQTGAQIINLCYPYYPNSCVKLKNICILHEMMHAMGFEHEHARVDRKDYGVSIDDDYKHNINNIQYSMVGNVKRPHIAIGKYDFFSVMHYGEGACGVRLPNKWKNIVDNEQYIKSYSCDDKKQIDIAYRMEAIRWIAKLYVTAIMNNNQKREDEWAKKYGLDSNMVKKAGLANTVNELETILKKNGITESNINDLIWSATYDILHDFHSLPYKK